MAKLLVTCRNLYGESQAKLCLRDVVEEVVIKPTEFRAVLHVEAEGDALELAEMVTRECPYEIARAVPILEEGESNLKALEELALRVALEYIKKDESFCFRLHKRGTHGLEKDTPEVEYEVGGVIHDALKNKFKKKPKVDLDDPDVTVVAEVLGEGLEVGIARKVWSED
ncbi:MAG: THUMP domain-containing protein [Candidatus Hydrothermarchaeales archaeon]